MEYKHQENPPLAKIIGSQQDRGLGSNKPSILMKILKIYRLATLLRTIYILQ